MQKDLKTLVSQMTLEEKAAVCSGIDSWHTKAVERLHIPSVMMTDGPHGVRHESDSDKYGSIPATCFPSGSALSCSWDRSLLNRLGGALSQECRALGASILLGPAANIKRSPLCGRNFEYYSEDPFLSSQMACNHIKGVQGGGVGASLKHFAANNKETDRMTTDTAVDERTLREIYLASFEAAVKEAKPWTVMCAYNKLNGEFCSENKRLLTDILRGEWGFDGFVMSDWGAVNERDEGIKAGLDLEMPSSGGIGAQKVIDAVKSGKLPQSALDASVLRILNIVFRAAENNPDSSACCAGEDTVTKNLSHEQMITHHTLAREIAGQCMVLLKNDGVLPLKKSGRLAVIGAFAKKQRYQGGGSSHINPTMLDIPLDEIKKSAPDLDVIYCDGYTVSENDTDEPDEALIAQAVKEAAGADAAVIFAGLPDAYESEGYDRQSLDMPKSHNALIDAVAKAQKNTAVVLSNGAPVAMPWIDAIPAVLEGYLCGQAAGGAAADILFGDVNPSGKLAETFPRKLSDNPSYLNFPGEKPDYVEYHEGVFVGYRYYEKKKIEPLFPFGHGLSYTSFKYESIEADKKSMRDDETLNVSVTVTNTGKRSGKETVQLYVHDVESSIMRPIKELRGFEKIFLDPGEKKTVTFALSKRAFAYYDVSLHDWYVEDGDFELLAGGSSTDTPLSTTVTVHPLYKKRVVYSRQSHLKILFENPVGREALTALMKKSEAVIHDEPDEWMLEMPLRSLHMLGGSISEKDIDDLVELLNSTARQ